MDGIDEHDGTGSSGINAHDGTRGHGIDGRGERAALHAQVGDDADRPSSRPSPPRRPRAGLSRRDVLRRIAVGLGTLGAPASVLRREVGAPEALAQPVPEPTRVYLAPDEHTDYMWSADEDTYRQVFLRTLDWALDRMDATADAPERHQARWCCDGSLWLWTYEQHRDDAAVARLVARMRSGHLSAPLNPLVCCWGGAPAEAVLRGMYYAGTFERRHGLRLEIACANENQTLPYGLASLFAGAGARYSWKGICGCATKIPDAGDRLYDIYWWQGPDGRRLLMKWHSLLGDNRSTGGYAEARRPEEAVRLVTEDARESGFAVRYPYDVVGLFGQGWDDLETRDDAIRDAAIRLDDDQRQVHVSNQLDFFTDFEARYGEGVPRWGAAFGNEWDLLVASMAEQTARVRRATEKLRGAEALAALACRLDPSFMDGRADQRERAFLSMGLYFEHEWAANGAVPRQERAAWQRRQADEVESYVDGLHDDGLERLAAAVPGGNGAPRFVVFNPLGWRRDGAVDLPWEEIADRLGLDGEVMIAGERVHVVDVTHGHMLPSQPLRLEGQEWLRVALHDVPAIGYRTVEVRPGPPTESLPPAAVVTRRTVVNDHFQLDVDEQGRITRLLDRAHGNRDLVRSVDGWAMNALAPGPRTGPGALEVESAGPVSVTLRAAGEAPLRHVTRITVWGQRDHLEIDNRITEGFGDTYSWRFGFELGPFELHHEEVGAICTARLQADGGHYSPRSARYDWLSLGHFAAIGDATRWATLSNADCAFFKAGRSHAELLDTHTPSIAVLAGGQVDGPDLGIRQQGGDERFLQRFALRVDDRYDAAVSMRFSMEHQNPLVATLATGRSGPLPADRFGLLHLDDPRVLPWAVKPAEEDPASGLTVRAWNLNARPAETELRISPPWTLRDASRTTHLETALGAAPAADGRLEAALGPWAMETWRLGVDRVGHADGRAAYLPALRRGP